MAGSPGHAIFKRLGHERSVEAGLENGAKQTTQHRAGALFLPKRHFLHDM
jgi:hypothetical protein